MTDTVDALELRGRLEAELDDEANGQAQRIVDDLLREQARTVLDEDTDDEGETTLVLDPRRGARRQLHIYPSDEPGVAYALEEAEWTGCAWRGVGRERLQSVEIDGRRYGATGRTETGP